MALRAALTKSRVASIALAAGLALAVPRAALALDLDSDAGILAGTKAAQQRLKHWDNRKIFGAQAVDERNREPYKPDGIRFGNYLILPSGEVRSVFEDNVYGTIDDRVSDFSVQLHTRVRAVSQFKRHHLNFNFGGNIAEYASRKDLNEVNGFGSVDGALEIDHAHTISMSLLSDYRHETRLAKDAPLRAREKTAAWRNKASVGITRDAGRLSGTLGASYESVDFADVTSLDGDNIDQDYRDTQILASDIKLKYRFSPGYSVTSRIRGMRTLKPSNNTGYEGDNWGVDFVVGVKAESSAILHWSFVAGYGFREFDDPQIDTAGQGLFELSARWIATQNATLIAAARREFDFTTSEQGSIATTAALTLQLEATRNLVFTIDGAYRMSEYLNSDRIDYRLSGALRMEYLHSKHVHFNAALEHIDRTSNLSDDAIVENRIWLGAKLLF
ncbi:MAG: outer membrane beta-barrel protein [Pseudomonadota bacterium]